MSNFQVQVQIQVQVRPLSFVLCQREASSSVRAQRRLSSNFRFQFPKSLPLPQKPMASVKKKILLIGEYSRLHNSLKEGLTALGHEVTLVSTGDDFKQFPSDILLQKKFSRGWKKKLKVGIFKLTGRDITSELVKRQFMKH